MKKRLTVVIAVILCVCCVGASIVTVCAAGNTKRSGLTGWVDLRDPRFVWQRGETKSDAVAFESKLLENAIREYFGIDEKGKITRENIAEIKTVTFSLSPLTAALDGKYAVRCAINDGVLPGVTEDVGGSAVVYDALQMVVRADMLNTSAVTDAKERNKINSFYVIKDVNDPQLSDEGRAQIIELFPNTAADAIAVIDPEAKPRELQSLMEIAAKYDILNDECITFTTVLDIPESDFKKLSALSEIKLCDGLTLENNKIEKIVSVKNVDNNDAAGTEAVIEKIEEIIDDMKASDNAAEARVELESKLLENAIREYYGLSDEDALTAEHLAGVMKIDVCLSKCNDGLQGLDGYDGKYALHVFVNDGAVPDENGGLVASIGDINSDLFGGIERVLGYDPIPVMVRRQYLDEALAKITDEYESAKFRSFYVVKSAEGLDDESREELITLYPACAISGTEFAVIDPMIKPRESRELLNMAIKYGFINDDAIVDSTDIKISDADLEKLACPVNFIFDND